MKFKVMGASATTGADLQLLIEATDESAATAMANAAGVLVSEVVVADEAITGTGHLEETRVAPVRLLVTSAVLAALLLAAVLLFWLNSSRRGRSGRGDEVAAGRQAAVSSLPSPTTSAAPNSSSLASSQPSKLPLAQRQSFPFVRATSPPNPPSSTSQPAVAEDLGLIEANGADSSTTTKPSQAQISGAYLSVPADPAAASAQYRGAVVAQQHLPQNLSIYVIGKVEDRVYEVVGVDAWNHPVGNHFLVATFLTDFTSSGLARVPLEYVGPVPMKENGFEKNVSLYRQALSDSGDRELTAAEIGERMKVADFRTFAAHAILITSLIRAEFDGSDERALCTLMQEPEPDLSTRQGLIRRNELQSLLGEYRLAVDDFDRWRRDTRIRYRDDCVSQMGESDDAEVVWRAIREVADVAAKIRGKVTKLDKLQSQGPHEFGRSDPSHGLNHSPTTKLPLRRPAAVGRNGASMPARPPTSSPSAMVPDDPVDKSDSALSLAKSYLSAGRWDAARTRLQQIIKSYPNTPASQEAKELLDEIKDK